MDNITHSLVGLMLSRTGLGGTTPRIGILMVLASKVPAIDIAEVGAGRILFSVDYPFSSNNVGRNFLDNLSVSSGDMEKISHRNAERLLEL